MTPRYGIELECAERAAIIAGQLLRQAFHSGVTEVDREAEQQIHSILTSGFPQYGYRGEELGFTLRAKDPEKHLWLVDPDDGTDAATAGFRGSAVSIALLRAGRPVLGVVYAYAAPDDEGDLFVWTEGSGPIRRNGRSVTALEGGAPETVLVSHRADRNPNANAELAAPLRFRAVPSIAYRLALVAAGEARVAVSLNGPVGWDYAGGHALLIGAGLDLYDERGEPVRYASDGDSGCGSRCFGGIRDAVRELIGRDWHLVFRRAESARGGHGLCWPLRGATVADAGRLARAQGCLLGQLAGDALGGLVEFDDAATLRSKYPAGIRRLVDGGCWNTLAGQPTDDSEMALALGRSILEHGGYDVEAAARAYAWWYDSHPFDIGRTTATAVSAAASAVQSGGSASSASRDAASRTSQANGALMRVSPIGIFGAGCGEGGAGEWAQSDALLTHPHRACQHSNSVFAEAIAFAIRSKQSPEDVYRFAIEIASQRRVDGSVMAAMSSAMSSAPTDYSTKMGWVLIALQNAFWQLLHAEGFEQGVVATVMAGGDTDTNAAIAGALLGAVHGRVAVPSQWTDRILTCRPISRLRGVLRPRPEAFWPVDAPCLAERLLWLGSRSAASVSATPSK